MTQNVPIYHLTPGSDYHGQSDDTTYQPASLAEEGFIHCTAGAAILLEVANAFFAGLTGELLALEIDPSRLAAPLKFEPPMPPAGSFDSSMVTFNPDPETLFPHIYGPLNRQAIKRIFALRRDPAGQWQMPE
jgi:uncharacterized protein (DUF952 family)